MMKVQNKHPNSSRPELLHLVDVWICPLASLHSLALHDVDP